MLGEIRRVMLIVLLGALSLSAAQEPEPVTLLRKPYIQQTTQHAATVVWRTKGQGTPIVRYGSSPEALTEVLAEGLTKFSSLIPDPDENGEEAIQHLHNVLPDTFQHEFTLTDLQPHQRYFYAIYDEDVLLAGADTAHYAQTLPEPGSDVPQRFWVVGDSGDGGPLQLASFRAMQAQVEASGRGLDAYLHLGDMAYNSGLESEFQDYFFDIYDSLLSNTVVWPTLGNHEGASSSGALGIGPYFDAYVVPTRGESGGVASGTESYYAFDSGNIHFVCLNSHDIDRTPTGEMAQWLREDLSQATSKWLIAFFHHPPYTKGTHDSDWELQLIQMREHIMPILESHGVDLVLCGHSHTYERSMLIDGAYATPTVVDGVVYDDGDGDPGLGGDGPYHKSEGLNPNEGTIAVVAGHGRGALQHFGLMPIMRRSIAEAGSFLLDVDGDRLTGYMINANAQIRDRFQIVKSGSVPSPTRLEHPWRPFGPRVTTALLGEKQVKVVIAPNPPAPDAVVYYTLDGTPPTEASSIYTGPLFLEGEITLRTFSTWRNGTRQSPETSTSTVPPNQLIGVRLPLLEGAHDVVERDGVVESADSTLTLGEGTVALRFPDLQFPEQVTITRAYLQFTTSAPDTLASTLRILALSDGLSLQEGPTLTERASTATGLSWEMQPWSFAGQRGSPQRSPDLSALIQPLIESGALAKGEEITFLLEAATKERGTRRFETYESDPENAPFLVINYEPLAPLDAAASLPPRFSSGTRLGEPYTRIHFRRFGGVVEGSPLTYVVESSPSMEAGTWTPLDDSWRLVESPLYDQVWQAYTLEHGGALEAPLFIRFRVSKEEPAN